MIARSINALNGTITYPLPMIAYYLLRYGDHTTTHPTAVHHVDSFNRAHVVGVVRQEDAVVYELGGGEDREDGTGGAQTVDGMAESGNSFLRGNAVAPELGKERNGEHGVADAPGDVVAKPVGPDRPLKLVDQHDLYKNRNEALSIFSPVELSMVFKGGKGGRSFPLLQDHALSKTHGHAPLARFHLPRIIGHIPSRPNLSSEPHASEAIRAERMGYAAFAISNFYTDRPTEEEELQGSDLWEKLIYWKNHLPRDYKPDAGSEDQPLGLDHLAWRIMDNLQLRLDARILMAEDAKQIRLDRAVAISKDPIPEGRKRYAPEEGEREEEEGDWQEDDEAGNGCGMDDVIRRKLLEAIQGMDEVSAIAIDHDYTLDAVRPLLEHPVHMPENLLTSGVLETGTSEEDWLGEIKLAQHSMKNKRVERKTGSITDAAREKALTMRLYIQENNPGGVQNRVGFFPEDGRDATAEEKRWVGGLG